MGSLCKPEWHVSFKEKVVHLPCLAQVADNPLLDLLELFILFFVELQTVSNVFLWHDQEVLVTDGTLGQRNVEVSVAGVDDQILFNRRVVKAEPAVLVFLHTRSLHLEVYFQEAAFHGQDSIVFRDKLLSDCVLFELNEEVRALS
jgi:hypothetical protein